MRFCILIKFYLMKVALFQNQTSFKNQYKSKIHRRIFLNEDESFDLFVLPEMFTSGFTMNPVAVAETMEGNHGLFKRFG